MHKLKEYLTIIRNKAICRPLVVANIVLMITICMYKITGIEEKMVPQYLPGEINMLKKAGFDEKDTIMLAGRVADVEVADGFGGNDIQIRLTDVYLKNAKGNKTLTTEVINSGENWQKLSVWNQSVQIWLRNDRDVFIGSKIIVSGQLDYFDRATNPGQFDSYKFYKNRGYLFSLKKAEVIWNDYNVDYAAQAMRKLRDRLETVIDGIYGAEDAAIVKAILLGKKKGMDADIRDTFQRNGISHILAISGLHISFLCMGLYRLLGCLGIRKSVCSVLSGAFLGAYIAMVGATASSVRAGIMFLAFLVARVLNRSYDLLSAMSLASIWLLLGEPGLLFDTAFQLSFLAVISIAVFYKWISDNILNLKERKHLFLRKTPGGLNRPLIIAKKWLFSMAKNCVVSGVVFMVTLPPVLCCYYEVAWYSVALNLLVIPLVSVLLVTSIMAILLTITVNRIAVFPLVLSKIILWIFKITCVSIEASGIGRQNLGAPTYCRIAMYYIILIFICNYRKRFRKTVFVTGVISCILLISVRVHSYLELYMVDVGQGDCIVAVSDRGSCYIFDGGSSSVSSVGDKRIIPFLKSLGVNEVEAIFLSHPDEDHISGIRELVVESGNENIEIHNMFVYKGFANAEEFIEMQLALEPDTCFEGIEAGFMLCDDGLEIECIYPDGNEAAFDANDSSLVLRLSYGDFSFLETGDIGWDAENYIIDNIEATSLQTDVLKVAHHGSKYSSSTVFLDRVSARLAIISVGENNRYGHPHEDTVERLHDSGAAILRTDESGCIRIITDGKNMKVGYWND